MAPDPAGEAGARRWVVLAVGLVAITAGCAFQYGLPYLIPGLRAGGLSLERAGLLVACPTVGLLLTTVAWGAAADRWGERLVLGAGLTLAGLALLGGSVVRDPVALGGCLVVAGAAGACVHAASGRLILGWFAAPERGLAMGIRQTGQPLGVALAALTLPPLSGTGPATALVFLGVLCVVAAGLVALLVTDPARPRRGDGGADGSPYRTPLLWRVHGVSGLLVVPQFAVATFGLAYLVDERAWPPAAAGQVLAVAQVGGVLARLGTGLWSDRVGSRLRPLRLLAVVIAVVVAGLCLTMVAGWALVVVVLVVAGAMVASPNGLAFTAVAEHAGPRWAGRALGIQNTVQNALASATPPVLAAVIAVTGYGPAFAGVVVFPLVAALLVPVTQERSTAAAARG
ncbi:Sugar phosphate permease [Goodfellowiella coeruleoviolacea]|uniref:Sugar phosphate permease n=1 Tax=Goodfellowiella coeruleoviolacea TaxID=334858 RepID=A0AAE3KDB1_9PSEU|nr:Sugar phosphate permease [Goodfellowiella coeruleoviolacea]